MTILKSTVTRRSFLGGTAAGTALLAAPFVKPSWAAER